MLKSVKLSGCRSRDGSIFSVLKSVKLHDRVYLGMVLDASKTISFFIAKINQLYAFYLELVLDASKAIFFSLL